MMKLTDPALLAGYMAQREITGARLGRKADVSRQFVYQLLGGHRVRCAPERAARIEVALGLIPGTLFKDDDVEPSATQTRTRESTAA